MPATARPRGAMLGGSLRSTPETPRPVPSFVPSNKPQESSLRSRAVARMAGTISSPRMAAWLPRIVLGLVILGLVPGASAAAPPGRHARRSKGGSWAALTPVSLDAGGSYVPAERLAAVLKGTWTVKGERGTLVVGALSAPLTRNPSRVNVG